MKTISLVLLLVGCSAHIQIQLQPTNPWGVILPAEQVLNGVPLLILDRLIESESSWRPSVINRNRWEHSVGLAQLNKRWLAYFNDQFGIYNPLEPSQALDFASRYLFDLYTRFGCWYAAVLAYKCGPSRLWYAPMHIRRISYWVVTGRRINM